MDQLAPIEKITGTLHRVIFHNPETGYIVAVLDDNTTIVGESIEPPQRGGDYVFSGHWTEHHRYGRQFAYSFYRPAEPIESSTMEKWLIEQASGVGKKRAADMVAAFGDDTLRVAKEEPGRLAEEVSGITAELAERISADLRSQEQKEASVLSLYDLFQGAGLGPRLTRRVLLNWGVEAAERVRADPYRLTEIPGIGFSKADYIALGKLGFAEHDPRRVRAGILYILTDVSWKNGHVCLPRSELSDEVITLIGGVTQEAIDARLHEMILQGEAVYDGMIYAKLQHVAEVSIVQRLQELLDAAPLVKYAIDSLPNPEDDALAPDQKKAIQQLVNSNVCLLVGAPGTGKTYTIRYLLDTLGQTGARVALCAPTGKAAKRMSELSGREAVTIHRLLKPTSAGDGGWTFQHGAGAPLDYNVVVVDEVSMLDNLLAHSLLSALRNGTRLYLVGDHHQLPSVGAGNVLKEMLTSGVVPSVELTEIKRQDEALIVHACHDVKAGLLPRYRNEADSDMLFIQRDSPESVRETICHIVHDKLPKLGFDPLSEAQVITALRKKTELGAKRLNEVLQDLFRPEAKGDFREGDKIIQLANEHLKALRNNGDEGSQHYVVNGDMGFIESVNNKHIVVRFENPIRICRVSAAANRLALAYAVTVHKYQGSEAPVIVVPIHRCLGVMIPQRNWLYTAISRAQRLCILVGDRREAEKIIGRTAYKERHTLLAQRLKREL